MPGFMDDWPGWKAAGQQYLGPHMMQGLENVSNLASFFSPASDVRDAMQASGDTMGALRGGDYAGAAQAAPWIPLALMGAMVPGSALPMGKASRLARAKEGGFNTDLPLYRGTTERGATRATHSLESGKGVFLTDNPDVAEIFRYPREYGEVLFDEKRGDLQKLYARMKNPLVLGDDAQKFTEDTIYQVGIIKDAVARGYDSIVVPNVMEGVGDTVERGTTYVILDPKNIRKTTAAFDPAKSDSRNLMAGIAGAGIIGASSFMEDR